MPLSLPAPILYAVAINAIRNAHRCSTHLYCACPQAEAFALLSEEGIAKGVRRIVAVTRGEAARAIAEGDRLAAELRAIGALPDEQLEKASKAFKEVGLGLWVNKSRYRACGCKGHTLGQRSAVHSCRGVCCPDRDP